jgi:acetylornithine deacetylase/succinyl-diaminopimelate desuccinylase-like protein
MLHLAAALLLAAPPAPAEVGAAVRAWRRTHEREVVGEFAQLLAIPNLASDERNIDRNALAIGLLLEKRGFRVRMLRGERGPSAVLATLEAPGATRTIGIYAHYDGQPVDAARWSSDPWTPVLRDAGGKDLALDALPSPASGEWRLYARSASDDKAPIIGIVAARDALRAAGIAPTVNVKLLLDGEEEAGSPNLPAIMAAHAADLKADLWLLCDGPVHPSRLAQVFYGARGVTGVELTVYGPTRSLHSGHYGNWAPNPALVLSHLLAGLRDLDGTIRIPGFLDDVRKPTDAELAALSRLPDVETELRRSLGLADGATLGGAMMAGVLGPSVNVRGLESARVAEHAANAIPTEARASIDFRLVPDQAPARVRERFEAHLAAQGFHVVHDEPDAATRQAHARIVRLDWASGGYPAARTDLGLPVAADMVRAVGETLGQPLVVVPTLGGSIPMHLFGDVLHAPVVGLPIANHDNNQHAANENIRLQNLWDGIEIYAGVLTGLAHAGPR